MLLQVHDELIFEVPDNEVAATLPVVQHVMQDAPFPAVLLSLRGSTISIRYRLVPALAVRNSRGCGAGTIQADAK